MERRDFMRLGMFGALGSSVLVNEASAKLVHPSFAGTIYFTQDAPGRWKGKEATHLPSIATEKSGDQLLVSVVTAHEMKGYEHYIVKHVLLNQQLEVIGEHLFKPEEDKVAASKFAISQYSGKLYALSMCNKHDVWVSSVGI